MKKVKLIGALMAAVLAAAPVTGFAGNVLSFNDNAIVADAAAKTDITVSTYKPFKVFGKGSEAVIMRNDNWELVANSTGDLYCRSRHGVGRKNLFNCPWDKYSIYPHSDKNKQANIMLGNGSYMDYYVYLQGDGNLVGYSYGNTDLPLYHTNSYTNAPKTTKYRNQKLKNLYNLVQKNPSIYNIVVTESNYELTANGDLIITAHYVCKCKNYRYDDVWCKVWDSRYDTIDRIV